MSIAQWAPFGRRTFDDAAEGQDGERLVKLDLPKDAVQLVGVLVVGAVAIVAVIADFRHLVFCLAKEN